MEYMKFARLSTGEIIETTSDFEDVSSTSILNLLKKGDLVKIEFYSPRYNERITRLFEVENIFGDGSYIVMNNSHINLTAHDGKFLDLDLEPVIKSVIPIEKLATIECDLSGNKQMVLRKNKK